MTTSHQKEQAERRSLVGSTTGMTFHSRASVDLELESTGRHALAPKPTVTGSARVPQVPRMPEGSPWADDLVPPEEALGWSVEAQEPTGNYHEIAESLREAASSLPQDGSVEAAREVSQSASQRAAPDVVLSPASGALLRRGRKL
jgi:hypothetical protein